MSFGYNKPCIKVLGFVPYPNIGTIDLTRAIDTEANQAT